MKSYIPVATVALLTLFAVNAISQSATITTYAGEALPVSGLPAVTQGIDQPTSVVPDGTGGFYVVSNSQSRVYLVARDGILAVVAGSGTNGFRGDGGRATSADLSYPSGLAVDTSGNVFIADTGNNRIRKVTPAGIITTVAGGGEMGDGASATSAQLSSPYGVFADPAGNIFIADSGNNRIREVAGGVITTVAGGGKDLGDGGVATSASLNNPTGVVVDAAGTLFIADQLNHRIRKVSAGIISTVAGSGTAGFPGGGNGDNAPAIFARLKNPTGVAVDWSGNLFIADTGDNVIRKVSAAGVITTIAGTGSNTYNGEGGLPMETNLNFPTGVATVADTLYIADRDNNRVRRVTPGQFARGVIPPAIRTVAGNGTNGYSGDGGPAVLAQLGFQNSTALDSAGNLFITDDLRVRKVSPSGIITTVAGTGTRGSAGDGGAASTAQLNFPYGVAVDGTGNLFIADLLNYRVRKVTPAGIITTFAGTGISGFSGDGAPAVAAQLKGPMSVAVEAAGNLFIGDFGRIRKVAPDGTITTFAGNGMPGYSGDGGPATAAALNDRGIALDQAGNLFIADYERIRKVSPDGVISTVAGNGIAGFSGDGGPATAAEISANGVGVGPNGDLFIADTSNHRIRKVSPDGVITTVAGNGTPGFSGDGGPPTAAQLNQPQAISVSAAGDLFIADGSNARIRRVSTVPQVPGGGGNGGGSTSNPLSPLPVSTPVPILEVEHGNTLSGYMVITPDANSAPATVTVTEGIVNEGVVQSQAGLLPSLLTTDATLPVDSIPSIGRNLALAIAFPSTNGLAVNAVTLTLLSQRGDTADKIGLTLLPNQQLARFVTELFRSASMTGGFQGSLHIQSSTPFSLLGLEFTGSLFSTLSASTAVTVNGIPVRTVTGGPVSNPNTPLAGVTGGTAAVLIPQFAISGGWATQLTLVNSNTTSISGRVDFFDPGGNPIPVPLNGNIQSTFTYTVPPSGTFLLAPRDANGQVPLP